MEHGAGILVHHWGRLEVEVSQHSIALPATDEADDVRVYVGIEEGHSATRAQGMGINEINMEAQGSPNVTDSSL